MIQQGKDIANNKIISTFSLEVQFPAHTTTIRFQVLNQGCVNYINNIADPCSRESWFSFSMVPHEREKAGEARGNSPHPTHPAANEFHQDRSGRIRVQTKHVSVLRISKMDR
jgi:hypothetical protein